MFWSCVCCDPDKRMQRHDTRTAGLFQSLTRSKSTWSDLKPSKIKSLGRPVTDHPLTAAGKRTGIYSCCAASTGLIGQESSPHNDTRQRMNGSKQAPSQILRISPQSV